MPAGQPVDNCNRATPNEVFPKPAKYLRRGFY